MIYNKEGTAPSWIGARRHPAVYKLNYIIAHFKNTLTYFILKDLFW